MLKVEGGGGGGGVKLVALSHGMADLVSYGDADRDIEQVRFTLLVKHEIFCFCFCFSFPLMKSNFLL